jgi:hypothetical protein
MRTNISRFSVAFSDLAWESVLGSNVPMFPRAWQVRRYLEEYARRYIPEGVVGLGRRVVKTARKRKGAGLGAQWEVHWIDEG